MRPILMIYEKFPPFVGSGTHRPYHFAKHLPEFGYRPFVVAARPDAKDATDWTPINDLGTECQVSRVRRLRPWLDQTFARLASSSAANTGASTNPSPTGSAARGQSPSRAAPKKKAIPWDSYWYFYWHLDWALPALMRSIEVNREAKAELVWVTAPHTRNLFAGYLVSLALRLPLVLDIRDPWTYGSIWTPRSERMATVERFWAKRILERASRTVFTSPLTTTEMQRRFPGAAAAKMCTITNGFAELENVEPRRAAGAERCVLSYVGSLNARRSPEVLLRALKLAREMEGAKELCLQFVGGMAGYDRLIREFGLEGEVFDVGRVSHLDSVAYMRGADVNVLLQTIDEGQDVIAGKTFEYLATGKPILAVVADNGGDAWLLREAGGGSVVSFESPEAVALAMLQFWKAWKRGDTAEVSRSPDLDRFSRRNLTAELAALLDEVLGPTT